MTDKEIRTNKELSQAVNAAIKESGYKKSYIANQLGIQKESFARALNKKQFSLDDANKILELLGLETKTEITKKLKKITKYVDNAFRMCYRIIDSRDREIKIWYQGSVNKSSIHTYLAVPISPGAEKKNPHFLTKQGNFRKSKCFYCRK